MNFDIKIEPEGNGKYRVELISGNRTPAEFMQIPDVGSLGLFIKAAWANSQKFSKGEQCKKAGTALFDFLFPRAIRDAWQKSQAHMDPEEILSLRLDIRAPELAALPWELLYDGHFFLAMTPRRPVVRYTYDVPDYVAAKQRTQPLKILVAVSTPRNAEGLPSADQEADFILQKLEPLRREGKVDRISILHRATLEQLRAELRKGFDVLHYIGHGIFHEEVGFLVLEDSNGNSHPIDAEKLAYFLCDTSVRLLVLNACETALPSPADPLLGVAQGALAAGVPAVIAMQGPIRDKLASIFAFDFYQVLAEGRRLETCMAEGRRAIMGEVGPGMPEWAVPVLFSNIDDGKPWVWGSDAPNVHRTTEDAPVLIRPVHNLVDSDYISFVDRESELQFITDYLAGDSTPPVVTIIGLGGSGRTALAQEVAQRSLVFAKQNPADQRSFRGLIWASTERAKLAPQGATNSPLAATWSLDDLFMTIARTLGRRSLMQATREERSDVIRNVLCQERFLLIINDADEVPDPRLRDFLRTLPLPSKAIVTSTSSQQLGGLEIQLSGLKHSHGVELVQIDARAADVQSVIEATPAELRDLVTQAAGLPLVLRWAVAQLRDTGKPISWVTDRLNQADCRSLAEFCVSKSIQGLTRLDQRLLQGFALYPSPTRAESAGEAAGVRGEELRRAANRLEEMNLIQRENETGLYRMMVLARQYSRGELQEDASFSEDATRRAVSCMCQFARSNAQEENWRGLDRLENEIGNLMWAADQAHEMGDWKIMCDFRQTLSDFLHWRGYWSEAIQVGEWAFEAACRLGDRKEQAWCALYPLARVHFYRQSYDQAQLWCDQSLRLFGDIKDDYGIATAKRYLGRAIQAKGELDKALTLFRDGLEKARLFTTNPEHLNLQGHLLAAIAAVDCEQERYKAAELGFNNALNLYQKTDDQMGVASMLQQLGNIALKQGRATEAERFFRMSLGRLRNVRWVEKTAELAYSLGLLAEERGDLDEALNKLKQAQDCFKKLGAAAELARVDAAMTRVAALQTYEQHHDARV